MSKEFNVRYVSKHFCLTFCAIMAICAIHVGRRGLGQETKPAAGSVPVVKTASPDAPVVGERIREAMQNRDYTTAIVEITAALKSESGSRDYLTYLMGRALYLQDKHDEAITAFEKLLADFPESPWTRRARFGKAISLARKGDFHEAEKIYRAEAEYLLSTDRKQEIADLYLEFADAYFQPEKESEKPNYQKALDFYTKAIAVGPKPEKLVEIELLVAECQQYLGKLDEAIGLYTTFVEKHADSRLDIEARFRLGECQLARGRHKEARRTWQDLLAKHDDSKSERIAEATFQLSRTWQIPKPGNDEQLSLGTSSLESFLKRFPEHKLAGQASLDMARSYVHRGRHEDAVASLQRFLADARYADRKEIPDARNLLGRSYQLQKKFDQALATWKEYLAKHPAHNAWSEVQREIINTEYYMGTEKLQAEKYDEAHGLWTEFLAKYPLDGRNARILFDFGRMNYQQEKWDAAIVDWQRLVSKYPGTNEASQGQYMIAQTLEEKQGKLDEALEEYRKVTWGSFVNQARQAATRLTSKSLAVATERVFRSNETPTLKLTTRNIETVTVRAYKVDLETYFRKMHLASGLEQLDISLIDPDVTFEFEVPEYAKYQQFESQLEVPLPEKAHSGVMAVTVSSKTLESTTMVLQSDLDMIVKSSRDEVFVFAQDMRTGKPWAGAKLLLSDGKSVFAEATTGDDGVLQQSHEELKNAQDIRVFAMSDGHVASNVVGLQGVGVARGLSDKGYIYTDRPAYRAGQIVHVRGCLRRVVDDAYTVESGEEFTLEVFDGRNRLVRQDDVVLNGFGAFHANFILPPASPQGQYRIQVRNLDERTYQGTFQVHEYKLEPVRLVIDTPRTVYYRGEDIEGTIRAEYYYGAPLADTEIQYVLSDDRTHTARTDAKGEVKFKLPTREYHETQTLPLIVTMPERNLQRGVNFLLASRGFSIGVSTIRPVYVAGETFEASISTRDAEGKPAGRKLTLKVLKQTTVQGKVAERLVETFAVESDADNGTARQTLKLEEGGRYVVRAEGTDRFDNPISGQHIVQVSDDKDNVRLRILADAHTFKVGDTAKVKVHWRDEKALALVAFQGAKILDYRLVELNKGANTVKIPMTAKLAPNFVLAVALMTDTPPSEDTEIPAKKFHEATTPFTVQRELRVAVATTREEGATGSVRPGEEVTVEVTTTDPQGKPVPAEVSLAMVEQSLLERFGWQIGSINSFFRGVRREPAVRTTSSITFAYRPTTKAIDRQLLAERERLEIEAEEAASRMVANVTAGGTLVVNGPDTAPATAGAFGEVPPTGDVALLGATPRNGYARVPGESQPMAQAAQQIQTQSAMPGFAINGTVHAGQALGRAFNQSRRALGQADFQQQAAQSYDGAALAFGSFDDDAQLDGGLAWGYAVTQADDVAELAQQGEGRQVLVLDNAGKMHNLQLRDSVYWNTEDARALTEELVAAGAVLLPNAGPQETGYWNPAVVTDDQGKATVTFTMPERSTAWKLMAKGITVDTLAGETTEELTVKKELFGQLKLPASFTDGDTAQIEASVHNDVVEKGTIQVTLKTMIGGRTVEEKKEIEATSKGIEKLVFPVTLKRPETTNEDDQSSDAAIEDNVDVVFELRVVADGKKEDGQVLGDVVRRAVPLKPFGMPVYATTSGTATGDATTWIERPANVASGSTSLEILIGPTVERSLLDIVLGPAPACQIANSRIASGMESATSDLMAALALQKLLGIGREKEGPESQAIDGRIRASIGMLVSAQSDDGGWSWTGRGGASNRFSTARCVWALTLARKSGYTVPDENFNKAIAFLRTQLAATANTDYETSAILLHALSVAGQGDFALANRLYRNRPTLSAGALAYLALAFAAMDRNPTALELLGLLGERNLDDTLSRRKVATGSLPWSHSPTELRALYALGMQQVAPRDSKAKQLIDWLLAHRTGNRWTPEKATGPATLALCDWFSKNRFESEKYSLDVLVNNTVIKSLDVETGSGTRTIRVPASLLTDGKQRVHFRMTGRGRFAYHCILGGFVPADKLKRTTQEWQVRRVYEPARLEVDGRQIPRGFGVLSGSYTHFRNPLTQIPVGRRGLVELDVYRQRVSSNTPQQHFEYLVVTEPIPSGATVIEKSVKGTFERFEVVPGAIVFYLGNRPNLGTIRYELFGYLPGEYRAAPTIVRNAHRPDQLAVANVKPIEIISQGTESTDKYRLTPQELLELGKLAFGKADYETAKGHLTELITNWNLRPNFYKETVEMLLDVHLELGPAEKIVHYFEIVKEKWPTAEIPFAKILKVGTAYDEMKEYERSYLVFRATVESSFRRESGVAGFLEEQGEFTRSVDTMMRLLREYPPEPYIAADTYALAQRVYSKAPEAAADKKLREQKINRIDLIRRAWRMLESFLTAYPDDPAADQAAFATANALLELEDYKAATNACNKYAKRYADSDLLDSYWYIIGFCHFATGEHQAALDMCRKVAKAKRRDNTTGREVESVNKSRAIYILGQVHHSLGEAAKAIGEYDRVKDEFVDAKEAIAYFSRKAVKLPEVKTVRPGEKAEVDLEFRNVATCDMKVYRIDLMKFSLLKRNLGGITKINLAGIRPHHEESIALGDGKDYRDRTYKLDLPLEEEGAYLVVCRGDNLHASGLVLVSPLAVEVQEDVVSGRVRTTVKDLVAGRYINDVHVKVIGSRNSEFNSGETDLRGIFIADGIQGTSTVIAQADASRYAFHRGTTELVPASAKPAAGRESQAEQRKGGLGKQGQKAVLLENLYRDNSKFQREQVEQLQRTYKSKSKGVEVQKAFNQ